MNILSKISLKKKSIEDKLGNMPALEAFFKVFLSGNFVLGITSGILISFFYLALKYTGYKYLMLFYAVRLFMYSWLVFYAGFSTIFMLKRSAELPQWALLSVYAYVLISMLCLYLFETFMPFQAFGSYLFHMVYKYFVI